MEWIVIIAIGFICVSYPILMLVCTFMMPWYVILAYFLWIILSMIVITRMNSKGAITITIILTIIFTIVFCSSIPGSNISYMFDDNKALSYIMPAFNLPAILYFGFKIKNSVNNAKLDRLSQRKRYINNYLEKEISHKKAVLSVLAELEKSFDNINKLLDLLSILDYSNGSLLIDKFTEYKSECFKNIRPTIIIKLPDSEKANFPQKYSELNLYKSAINDKYQNLLKKKNLIQNATSEYEIRKLTKKIVNT